MAESDFKKRQKLELVEKLIGPRHPDMLTQYSKMIKVLPQEFDLEQMKRLRHNVTTILRKPDPIYALQAKVHPKHH